MSRESTAAALSELLGVEVVFADEGGDFSDTIRQLVLRDAVEAADAAYALAADAYADDSSAQDAWSDAWEALDVALAAQVAFDAEVAAAQAARAASTD